MRNLIVNYKGFGFFFWFTTWNINKINWKIICEATLKRLH